MTKEICGCTYCEMVCSTDQALAQVKVYDAEGFLDYILIAHIGCVPAQDLEQWEHDAATSEDEPDDLLADGEALASAGMGTDEDYGYYGEEA